MRHNPSCLQKKCITTIYKSGQICDVRDEPTEESWIFRAYVTKTVYYYRLLLYIDPKCGKSLPKKQQQQWDNHNDNNNKKKQCL